MHIYCRVCSFPLSLSLDPGDGYSFSFYFVALLSTALLYCCPSDNAAFSCSSIVFINMGCFGGPVWLLRTIQSPPVIPPPLFPPSPYIANPCVSQMLTARLPPEARVDGGRLLSFVCTRSTPQEKLSSRTECHRDFRRRLGHKLFTGHP